MGQCYLALVDSSGLRALLPENDVGLEVYSAVKPRIENVAGFWAILDADVAPNVDLLLECGESDAALRLLRTEAIDGGPFISDCLPAQNKTFSCQ